MDFNNLTELPCVLNQILYVIDLHEGSKQHIRAMQVSAIGEFRTRSSSLLQNICLEDKQGHVWRSFNDFGRNVFADKADAMVKLIQIANHYEEYQVDAHVLQPEYIIELAVGVNWNAKEKVYSSCSEESLSIYKTNYSEALQEYYRQLRSLSEGHVLMLKDVSATPIRLVKVCEVYKGMKYTYSCS